ncbi:MAG: dihydrofolate reductase family protein [Chloroflexota bacterium]
MARLIYTALMSLDGFIADEDGQFDWAMPDDDVHHFINNLMRPIGTYLYGRKLYEVMVAWETMDSDPDQPRAILDFAGIWQHANKVVYSRTLESVASSRTRIEPEFNPEAVREMKSLSGQDMAIGGPDLAASAFRHGLIDECHIFIAPVIVGGGKRGLPDTGRLDLQLVDERRFGNGMVYLHHRAEVRGQSG